jgi:hypothetical protein
MSMTAEEMLATALREALASSTGQSFMRTEDKALGAFAHWLAKCALVALDAERMTIEWDECLGAVARASSRTTVPLWRLRGLEANLWGSRTTFP